MWLADRMRIVNQSIRSLPSEKTVDGVSGQVARTGQVLGNAAAAAVFLPSVLDRDQLELRGSHGFARDYIGLRMPTKHTRLRKATHSEFAEVEDLQAIQPTYPEGPGKKEGMGSLIELPLIGTGGNSGPGSSGLLVIYSRNKRIFEPSTRRFLQQFALSAGSVIESRRRAEENEELRQALRVAAHSVRGPLDRLAITLASLRDQTGDKFVNEIETAFASLGLASARLWTMLYSHEGLIKVTGLNKSRVDLNATLSACVTRHRQIAAQDDKDIVLHHTVSTLPTVIADADKLDLVFDNLIENAVKYSWRNKSITVSGDTFGESVRIFISDQGLV